MHIHRITLSDKLPYQQLLHRAYAPVVKLGIYFAAADANLALIEQHIQTNLVYGVFAQDNPICTISLRLPWGNNPGPYGVPHIGWFATDPDFAHQGLAKKLLTWLEQHILLAQLNLPFVTLGTAENHPWLNRFYQKNGFTEISRVNLTADHTTIYYRKILDPALFQLWQFTHSS